jgi:hypothetical protein
MQPSCAALGNQSTHRWRGKRPLWRHQTGQHAGSYTIEASAGDGSTSTTVTIEPGKTVEVELSMERFSKITGKVLDKAGNPVAGAELLIGSGSGGRIEIMRDDGDPQYVTEKDGSFEIHAAAGSRVLLVQSPDSPMPIAIKPFTVESGQNLDLGEIRQEEFDGMMMGAKEEMGPPPE